MADEEFIDMDGEGFESLSQNDTQPIPPSFNHEIEEDEFDTPYVKTRVAEIKKAHCEANRANAQGKEILSTGISEASLSLTQCRGLLVLGIGRHKFDRLRVEIRLNKFGGPTYRDYSVRHVPSGVFYRLSSTTRLQIDAVYNFIGNVDIPLGMIFEVNEQYDKFITLRAYLIELDESKIAQITALYSQAFKESLDSETDLRSFLTQRIPMLYSELPDGRYTTSQVGLCKMVSGETDFRVQLKNYGFMEVNGDTYFMSKCMYDFIAKRYKLLQDGLRMYPIHVTFFKAPGRMTMENCDGPRNLLRPEALREEVGTPTIKLQLPMAAHDVEMEEGSDEDVGAYVAPPTIAPPVHVEDNCGTTKQRKRLAPIRIKSRATRPTTLNCFPDGNPPTRDYNTGGDMEPPAGQRRKREVTTRKSSNYGSGATRSGVDREFFYYLRVVPDGRLGNQETWKEDIKKQGKKRYQEKVTVGTVGSSRLGGL